MTAIESLLEGLIDYAGLYPPAELDLNSALSNYLSYGESRHAAALGSFVIGLSRLMELREVIGYSMRNLKLTVVCPSNIDENGLSWIQDQRFHIDAIEINTDQPLKIEYICKRLPSDIKRYFEIPVQECMSDTLQALADSGARAKLRVGGVTAEKFPSTAALANMLASLKLRKLAFKATAGLHHPIRSCHPFTYDLNSPFGMMHGFLNLFLAAALIHYGGEMSDANRLLNEQDYDAWQATPEALSWHSYRWDTDQLRTLRKEFAISFGACSFLEPIHGLEALGWL